jgi:hypothetical protein
MENGIKLFSDYADPNSLGQCHNDILEDDQQTFGLPDHQADQIQLADGENETLCPVSADDRSGMG